MKKMLLQWAAVALAAVAFTSCAYDPYYAGGYDNNPEYGGAGYGYSGGYGYGAGYGYGGPGFSTSFFVSTGDPRWGYDPYSYCYYDYSRRCYYDPYLYGYYPLGYRPYYVAGCPHPYGWRPGHGHCQPPHMVRNTTLRNYQNRAGAYRNSNYGWAHQVRMPSSSNPRHNGNHFNNGNAGHSNSNWTSRSNSHSPYGPTNHQGTTSSYWQPKIHPYSSSPNSQHTYTQDRSKFSNGGYALRSGGSYGSHNFSGGYNGDNHNFSSGSNVRSGAYSNGSNIRSGAYSGDHNFSGGYSGGNHNFSSGSSVHSGNYSGGTRNFSGGSTVRSSGYSGGSGGGNHGSANSSKGNRGRDR